MTWFCLFATYYFGFQVCRLLIYGYRKYARVGQFPSETRLSNGETGGEIAWLLCPESGDEEQEEEAQAHEIPLHHRVGEEKESKESKESKED
jgi:hypothetical protein